MRFRKPWGRILVVFLMLALAACAPPVTPATPSPTAAPATPGGPAGKLTPRLQQLADSPSLRAASPEEQARVLGLAPQGPGSLVRDAQGRLLVTLRTSDVSDAFQKTLRGLGADISSVSAPYQSVSAYVPLDQLSAVAGLPAVLSVQEELAPVSSSTPGG